MFKVGDNFIGFRFEDKRFNCHNTERFKLFYTSFSMDKYIGKVGEIIVVERFSVDVYFKETGAYWTYPINQKGLPAGLYNPKHILHHKKI